MNRRAILLFFVVLLAVALIPAVSFRATHGVVTAGQQVARSLEAIALLESTLGAVADAETGTRGYGLTGQENFLQPYYVALQLIQTDLARLSGAVSADPAQQQRLAELKQRITRKLELQAENISARRGGGVEAVAKLVAQGRGQTEMQEIRRLIAEMERTETELLRRRTEAAEAGAASADRAILMLAFFAALLATGAALKFTRDMAARQRTQKLIEETNQKLSESLALYEHRNQQIEMLGQLSSLLQSCVTPEEAYAVVVSSLSHLLPGRSGALSIIRDTRDAVEVRARWGGWTSAEQVFTPADCWALRRGRIYVFDGQQSAIRCSHALPSLYVCAPLAAHGETIGLLTLEGPRAEDMKLIEAAADEVGLALANLRLQQTLRAQSVQDPLTGLFNRRYLEQTLSREIVRSRRKDVPLAVLLFDVDHFKKFNDTYGHQAGDDVLKSIGELVRRNVRADDVPARYGGEEFAVVLPDAGREIAQQRAEWLRQEVAALNVRSNGQSLGPVTTSIGVAWFPPHGETGAELLAAADRALYAAKAAGRNRVILAEEAEPSLPPR